MRNNLDGGEAILEAFRTLGIEYIVTSPGSEWSPVWEAMSRQTLEDRPGPKFIQCWHETLAINIATGFTMMTGRPQVVLLHAAAGMLQGAMGLYGAMRAEIPMLVMSGESVSLGEDPERPVEGQWYAGVSVGGSNQFTASLAKWSGRVHSPVLLYPTVLRGADMAVRVPKGPVHLDVPMEYMMQGWTQPAEWPKVPLAPKTAPLPDDVTRVARALIEASNPVIVTEHAGNDPEAFHALLQLAELLAIPVIGTPGASCTNFPQDNPLWLGVGAYQHLEKADLVLLVGARTPWYPPSQRRTAGRIVAMHDHPVKHWLTHQNLQADEYLEGDVATALRALAGAVQTVGLKPDAVSARHMRWSGEHQKLAEALQSEREKASALNTISVPAICAAMAEVLPPETIYVEETITHAIPLRRHLPLNRPQSFFRHNGGGLGQGIGMSLGIKLAAPDRPVVLFVGDGSMLYNPIVQALGASQQYGLPILIVVLNNSSYASMGIGHKLYYPDGVAGKTPFAYGVQIDGPPYEELGRPFGFHGERAQTPAEFRDALAAGFASVREGRTAIINAIVPAS